MQGSLPFQPTFINHEFIAAQICRCDGINIAEANEEFHGLKCNATSELQKTRHDLVFKHLVRLIKKINLECTVLMIACVQLEDKLNTNDPELPKRISDFRIEYPTSRVYWVDVAIVNPAAPTCIRNGSETTEYIVTIIEETQKVTKFARFLLMGQAGRFIRFVLEATGRLGCRTQAFLEEIARMRRAVITTGAENERMENLRRYTVALLQSPFCLLMLGCLQPSPSELP